MLLASYSKIAVLFLVATFGAQTFACSQVPVVAAQTFVGQPRPAGLSSTPSDDWPTYHRDMLRSGYDPAFPEFNSVSLHWKSPTLDGEVYAEPLVVGTAVIVATENNSLYEFNATTGQTIWKTNLGTPVSQSVLPCGNINPTGITGTPVIDTVGRTIFATAFLAVPLHHELFAVDLDNGTIKFQRLIDPQGAKPTFQQQRAALALSNGYVYVGYGGLSGDCGPYHGWLASSSTSGGGPLVSYQVPTGRAGAIWGGGDGPVVDGSGDLLVATGNSDATSTFDFGDSVIKLSPATSSPIKVLDYFAPPNWARLNEQDLDLGSTEPVTLNSNFLFQIGKEGVGYLLSAKKLGQIGGQLYSAQVCTSGHGAYGGLAYSSPYLVVSCDNGVVALKVNLASKPPFTVAWRGPNYLAGPPIIAGDAVWDVNVSDGSIEAFNLTNGQVLFQDTIGFPPTHFNSVSAGDGQIFVTASSQLRAYLPSSQPPTMKVSYAIAGGGSPTPPIFKYAEAGVPETYTLTATPTPIQVDIGSRWSVTPNPLTGSTPSQQWESGQPLSGGALNTTIVFTFYHEYLQMLSYTISGGGTPAAPTFTANRHGAATPHVLTKSAAGYWYDSGSPWSISPNPLAGSSRSERWDLSQPFGVISGSSTQVFTFYHQYIQRISYSISGGGTPSPPTFTANQFGSLIGQPITTMVTSYWFDYGSTWAVNNPLDGSPSERWYTTQTSGTITSSNTFAFAYQHQYLLTMIVNPPASGSVTPSSNWYAANSRQTITAKAKSGYKFIKWAGTGTGSYTGTSASKSIVMGSAITETANFDAATTATSTPTGPAYVLVDEVLVTTVRVRLMER